MMISEFIERTRLETLSESNKLLRKTVTDLEAQLAEYRKADAQLKVAKNLIAVLSK